MPDYLKLIKEQDEEYQQLDKRMQADADLFHLEKFVLSDIKGKAVPDIVNMTLNKPKVFGDAVISALGGVSQQTIVESSNEKVDTHEIEEFQDAAFASANALRMKRRLPALNPFADTQLCIRGRTARRIVFQMVDGILVPDIATWDGRYVRYGKGKDGLAWVSYNTEMSKGEIESQDWAVKEKYSPNKKISSVTEVWDTEHSEIFVGEDRVWEEEHEVGYVPVVIEVVSLGYGDMLLDKNHLRFEGESIFASIRDIVPALNGFISILQTLNLKAVKGPAEQIKIDGGEPSDYEDVLGSGAITGARPGEGTKMIEYGDVKRAAEMLYPILEKAMQEGSLDTTALGNLQFPLAAITLVELGERQGKVLVPRLQSKSLLNQATAEMFTRQILAIGGTIELGTPGHKRKFKTSKLDGEYETTYKYQVKSPKTDIARQTVAQAAERYYDPETILKDVLQEEDWQGIMQKRYYFIAEKISQNVLMRRTIVKLLELAEDGDEGAKMDANILMLEQGMSIEQIKQGVLPKPSEPSAAPVSEIPLLGKPGQVGGIPSSAKQAGGLEKTQREIGG